MGPDVLGDAVARHHPESVELVVVGGDGVTSTG
jgi:hypothetical protein